MKSMTLAFAGLEPDDLTDFRRVFGKLRSQLGTDWRLVESDDADLTVVDIDSIYGHMDWLKLTGSGMRAAVYTSAQYAKESDLVLFKPLAADNLADILNAVAAEQGHTEGGSQTPQQTPAAELELEAAAPEAAVASAPSESVAPPEPAPAVLAAAEAPAPAGMDKPRDVHAVKSASSEPAALESHEPEPETAVDEDTATIGEWLLRGKFSEPVRMLAGEDVWIVDPDREAYYGPATLKPLSQVLDQTTADLQLVNVTVLERARKGQAQPLARLRWYAGLVSSPGKLSPALQAGTRFGLARWPQIEREFPRHFRIATAMMKQAGSVAELSAISGAPEADFVNASHAVGIVNHDGAEAEPQSRGRVMSRLRGR